MDARHWLVIGGVLGALGVGLGAFGAHGLKQQVDAEKLAIFEVGVRYQMYHALAILAVGLATQRAAAPSHWLGIAGWAFLAGTLVFSGLLYAMTFGAPRWFGAIVPFGGTALIVGWIALAFGAWQSSAPR